MNSNAFFSDQFDEYEAVKAKIEKLITLDRYKTDITFVFPTA